MIKAICDAEGCPGTTDDSTPEKPRHRLRNNELTVVIRRLYFDAYVDEIKERFVRFMCPLTETIALIPIDQDLVGRLIERDVEPHFVEVDLRIPHDGGGHAMAPNPINHDDILDFHLLMADMSATESLQLIEKVNQSRTE